MKISDKLTVRDNAIYRLVAKLWKVLKHCLRVKLPFLLRRMPAILSGIPDAEGWYAGVLLEQTRFGCHELKSKNDFRTKPGEIHQIIF